MLLIPNVQKEHGEWEEMDSNSDSTIYQQQLQVSYYFPELHFPYLSEEDINICTEYILGLSEDQMKSCL